MISSRLLVAVVLLGSGFAFAQAALPSERSLAPTDSQNAAATPEPWRILPNKAGDATVPQARLEASQVRKDMDRPTPDTKFLLPNAAVRDFVIPPFALADGTCFAIRSYVVARDSKDSDSVHPAGYSTCVPANKYRIRKVERSGEATQVQEGAK